MTSDPSTTTTTTTIWDLLEQSPVLERRVLLELIQSRSRISHVEQQQQQPQISSTINNSNNNSGAASNNSSSQVLIDLLEEHLPDYFSLVAYVCSSKGSSSSKKKQRFLQHLVCKVRQVEQQGEGAAASTTDDGEEPQQQQQQQQQSAGVSATRNQNKNKKMVLIEPEDRIVMNHIEKYYNRIIRRERERLQSWKKQPKKQHPRNEEERRIQGILRQVCVECNIDYWDANRNPLLHTLLSTTTSVKNKDDEPSSNNNKNDNKKRSAALTRRRRNEGSYSNALSPAASTTSSSSPPPSSSSLIRTSKNSHNMMIVPKEQSQQHLGVLHTVVHVKLTTKHYYRSAMTAIHDELQRLYKLAETTTTSSSELLYNVRNQIAGVWCLYAHVCLELLGHDNNNNDNNNNECAAAAAALSVLTTAVSCPLVGNHAWIALALVRCLVLYYNPPPPPPPSSPHQPSSSSNSTAMATPSNTKDDDAAVSSIRRALAVCWDALDRARASASSSSSSSSLGRNSKKKQQKCRVDLSALVDSEAILEKMANFEWRVDTSSSNDNEAESLSVPPPEDPVTVDEFKKSLQNVAGLVANKRRRVAFPSSSGSANYYLFRDQKCAAVICWEMNRLSELEERISKRVGIKSSSILCIAAHPSNTGMEAFPLFCRAPDIADFLPNKRAPPPSSIDTKKALSSGLAALGSIAYYGHRRLNGCSVCGKPSSRAPCNNNRVAAVAAAASARGANSSSEGAFCCVQCQSNGWRPLKMTTTGWVLERDRGGNASAVAKSSRKTTTKLSATHHDATNQRKKRKPNGGRTTTSEHIEDSAPRYFGVERVTNSPALGRHRHSTSTTERDDGGNVKRRRKGDPKRQHSLLDPFEQLAADPDLERVVVHKIASYAMKPQLNDNAEVVGKVIRNGFFWRDFPTLEEVLYNNRERVYECKLRGNYQEMRSLHDELLDELLRRAAKAGVTFEKGGVGDDDSIRLLRHRLCAFYKSHLQAARKRLATLQKNSKSPESRRFLEIYIRCARDPGLSFQDSSDMSDPSLKKPRVLVSPSDEDDDDDAKPSAKECPPTNNNSDESVLSASSASGDRDDAEGLCTFSGSSSVEDHVMADNSELATVTPSTADTTDLFLLPNDHDDGDDHVRKAILPRALGFNV